jgi:hypothetical protein
MISEFLGEGGGRGGTQWRQNYHCREHVWLTKKYNKGRDDTDSNASLWKKKFCPKRIHPGGNING